MLGMMKSYKEYEVHKMSKKVLGIIIAAVVVLAGTGVGAYFYLTNTPKNAYLLSEKQSYEKLDTYFSERFKDEITMQNEFADSSYKAGLTVGVELPESMISSMGIQEEMVNSSKIEISMANDPTNKTSQLAINPTIADSEIGNIGWSADKEFQYIEAPILENPLKMKNNAIIQGLEKLTGESMGDVEGVTNDTLNLNTVMSSMVTKEQTDKIAQHYLKFILEEINEDNFKKDSATVDVLGKETKLDSITMDLSDKEVKAIVIATLNEAKKDKDLREIVKKSDATIDYDKELDKIIKDAEKETDYPSIKSVIYVDGKDIQKRVITMGSKDDQVNVTMDTKIDKDIALKATFSTADDENLLVVDGTSKGQGTVKDAYTFTTSDGTVVTATNDEELKDKKRTNAMVFNVAGEDMEEFEFKYDQTMMTDAKNNKQESNGIASFDVSGETIKVLVDTNTKMKEEFKLDIPKAVDVDTMSDTEVTELRDSISENLMGLIYGVSGGF